MVLVNVFSISFRLLTYKILTLNEYFSQFSPHQHNMSEKKKRNIVKFCEYCGATRADFKTQEHFCEHYKKHAENEFQCNQCKMICSTKIQLRKHVQNVHGHQFKCTTCNEEFSKKIGHVTNVSYTL